MTRTAPARVALLLLVTAAAVMLLAGTAAASQWASEEQRLVDKLNVERRAGGLGELRVDAELQRVARDWTAVMAREDRLYHNPNLGSQVQRDWLRLAENVGWYHHPTASVTEHVDNLHTMFMSSDGHRTNIMRPEFNWVGVGVRVTASGKVWATVTFMHGSGRAPDVALAPGEFRDVSGGPHASAIKAIALRGVTQGCSSNLFCPATQVTRGQMASFLVRALDLPPAARDHFTDDNGSTHERAVNALAAAGIANGCGQGRFCPNAPVTRGQMASFLQRAWGLPVGTVQRFTDVGPSVHGSAIDAIAQAGITLGCGDGHFCPNQPVRRAEMASFLARALNLV